MFRKLRQKMGRLGVVMTFVALLFAAAAPLEAMACAAEGCGAPCLEQSAGEASAEASDGSDPASGGCVDDTCLCAVGHCHAANLPEMIETTMAPEAVGRGSSLGTEALVPAAPDGLERPPRA